MPMRWLITALLFLPGCLAHERAGDPVDAGSAVPDATPPVLDAGPQRDAGPDAPGIALDAGPAACTHDETAIGIRIEAVTTDVARCDFTHAAGATLLGVDPAAADEGIRVHFDLCPTADADCRCDVVVSHVGTDIAGALGRDESVTVDVAPGDSFFPGAHLSITKMPTCECNSCACSEPLYLYAATAAPDFAPAVPAPLVFRNGPEVCAAVDCSFGGTSMLHAQGDVGEADVASHTQVELGSIHVRNVRAVEVFEPCAACAGCATPTGAWIAWVDSRLTP